MVNNDILGHVIEIKERLVAIETKLESTQSIEPRVAQLEQDAASGKASVKLLKWIVGIVIAIGVGLLKAWKN